jgi:hypothetical protein
MSVKIQVLNSHKTLNVDRVPDLELFRAIDTVRWWSERKPRTPDELERYEELERIAAWRAW